MPKTEPFYDGTPPLDPGPPKPFSTETDAPVPKTVPNGPSAWVEYGGGSYPLSPVGTRFGRSVRCEIRLDRQNESEFQALVTLDETQFVILDGDGTKASLNGTYLNGSAVRSRTRLTDGDTFYFADRAGTQFVFRTGQVA